MRSENGNGHANGNGETPHDGNRDARGRYLKGHKIPGPGPRAWQHGARLRNAMMLELSEAEIRRLIRQCYSLAIDNGDIRAAEFVGNRAIGPAVALDMVRRLARVEEALGLTDDAEETEPVEAAE